MPAETNFLQWDGPQNNIENDATYAADSQRTNGASDGSIFPSATANKLFYQPSTMCAALAWMLVNKGYSPVDGTSPFTASGTPSTAVLNLATVLANMLTNADLPGLIPQIVETYSSGIHGVGSTNPLNVNFYVAPVNGLYRLNWYLVVHGLIASSTLGPLFVTWTDYDSGAAGVGGAFQGQSGSGFASTITGTDIAPGTLLSGVPIIIGAQAGTLIGLNLYNTPASSGSFVFRAWLEYLGTI